MSTLTKRSAFPVRLWKSYKRFRRNWFARIAAIRAAFTVSRQCDEISEALADFFEKQQRREEHAVGREDASDRPLLKPDLDKRDVADIKNDEIRLSKNRT